MDVNMSTQAVTARDIAAGKAGVSGGQKTSEAGGFMELIMQLCGSVKCGQQVPAAQAQDGLLEAFKKKMTQETPTDALQMIVQMLMMNPEFAAENVQMPEDLSAMTEQLAAIGLDVPQLTQLLSAQEELSPEMLKMLESLQAQQSTPTFTVVKSEEQSAQPQIQPQQDAFAGQNEFQNAVAKAQSMISSKTSAREVKEEKPLNVETLQKDVDAGKYLGAAVSVHPNAINSNTTAEHVDTSKVQSPQDVFTQVKTGLEQGIQSGKSEFVIKLKPEGLGEITVHMVSNGSKIALNIVTSNTQTERLLNSELVNLRSVLRPMNAEVQQITSQSNHPFDSATYHQSLFQQQQHQSAYYNRGGKNHPAFRQFETSEESAFVPQNSYTVGTSALDQYI